MRIIPKTNTLRKSILIYRRIRHRKGHGVHSPFVFNLITKVIEEKGLYYSFKDIELVRKQLLFKEDKISYPDRHHKGKIRTRTIAKIVEREAIKPKAGALLFKLTNYFKPQNILQIGPSMGLSALYMTSYKTGLNCIALEHVKEFAAISQWTYSKAIRNPIDLRIGEYKELLPQALKEMGKLDFVYFNTETETGENQWLFDSSIQHIHNQTVFVIKGIKANRKMKEFWDYICSHPEVTVTLDLYSLGLVIFNKKLHKRKYKVYF